jgi:hypothetical protein
MDIKSLKVPFEHTTAELELILAGLRKLPMELVQELHDRIIHSANAEVQKQMTPAETPVEAPAEANSDSIAS